MEAGYEVEVVVVVKVGARRITWIYGVRTRACDHLRPRHAMLLKHVKVAAISL